MKTKFIAEIGSNHLNNFNRITRLIRTAKEIGCWAVKFQLFSGDQLYASEFKKQIKKMDEWQLDIALLPFIKSECQKQDIKFICTPFDLKAIDILSSYVDYFKVGSYENQWLDLIKAIAETNKPWILSAGMLSTLELLELELFIEKEITQNTPKIVLHCNSNYPAKPENCTLDRIWELKKYFSHCSIGWSDHTVEPGVIYKAIGLGARFIEFHFDLDEFFGNESEIGHVWPTSKIGKVIRNVKVGELAIKSYNTNEDEAKKWRTDPNDGLRPLIKYREELFNVS